MNKSLKSINRRQSVILTNYNIVKAHGGTISVESAENSRTEFIIQISTI